MHSFFHASLFGSFSSTFAFAAVAMSSLIQTNSVAPLLEMMLFSIIISCYTIFVLGK